MIVLHFYSNKKLIIDFTFFTAIALFFYFDDTGIGFLSIAACIIHEIGHVFALAIKKKSLFSLTFYGGGIKMGYEKNAETPLIILMSGSLLNLIVFAVLYYLFQGNYTLKIFAVLNLIIGVFNLLPLKYFDGGRIFEKVLVVFVPMKVANFIIKIKDKITVFFVIILSIYIITFFNVNISVLLVVIYIIFTDIVVKTNH